MDTSPVLGEVRVHAKTGTLYIWEFVPGGDRPDWLRFETWVRGSWRDFPESTAREEDLRRLDRRAMRLGGPRGDPTFARLTFE